jgi:hypothetical protein
MRTTLFPALICIGLSAAGTAQATAITAYAQSATDHPTPVSNTLDMRNGDFHISANPAGAMTGDGIDEFTDWAFDFTGDPNYAVFLAGGTVDAAILTLTLRTDYFFGGVAPITDRVIVSDGSTAIWPQWNVPSYMNTPDAYGYETASISVDLIAQGGLLPSQVFGWLGSHGGLFPMNYGDDALVVDATLQLANRAQAVPEPGSLALAGIGALGLIALRGSRSQAGSSPKSATQRATRQGSGNEFAGAPA